VADADGARRRRSWLWPLAATPGTLWLIVFFVAPGYVVLAILFGLVDPVLRTAVPAWSPIYWDASQFTYVLRHIVGEDGFFGPALVRTAVYVLIASALCVVIAYPVAYYAARIATRRKGLLLAALVAPFWISYMMRMLAWINLLQNDGLVNDIITFGGLWDTRVDWLGGHDITVVLGLVYGYVPYMILPLYAGLERIPTSMLEAGRDLGANRFQTWWRVTWPMSQHAVVTSVILTCLPMLGDYFTSDLMSGKPGQAMVGNLINNAVLTPGQAGQSAAFVVIVLIVSLVPMALYVRATRAGEEVRT